MNNMLLFLVKGISGGTATLSYRIGQKFHEEGFDIVYLYDLRNDINNENILREEGFRLVRTNEKEWRRNIVDCCKGYKNAILMTFTIDYFLLLDMIDVKGVNIHKYLYVVSTASIVRGASKETISKLEKIACNFSNILNRRYINELYENNQLLFMDDVTIEISRNNFMLPFKNAEQNVYLLPYTIKKKPEFKFKNNNIILTMSRISFPFKAYLIGLLDIFANISEIMSCELWIIGDGESKAILEEKISSMPSQVKTHIKMINYISYDRIGETLSKGKVFVGMGTSILDASSNGIPSLAVSEYRTDCVGKGWFVDYPKNVGFLRDDNEVQSLEELLISVLKMNEAEYIGLSEEHYKCVKEYYGMDSFFTRLLENAENSIHRRNKYILGPLINKMFSKARKIVSHH